MEKENPKKSLDYYHIHFLLLHEFKLGNKADQAVANINRAWGPGTTSRTTPYDWYEKFARGDTSLEEKEGRGRKSKLSDEALKEVVEANPRTTLCALATLFEVNKSTIPRHLAAIGKVRKLEKWIPHELTENQKLRRFEVASSLLLRNKTEPFLNRIITCDEKWILYNNRKRSGQWVNKGEPAGHFPKQDLYPKKIMVTVWWSAAGLIQYSFLQPGETITAESYSAQLAVCHQKLAKMQPALVNRKGPILLHDNARPHVGLVTQRKLAELGIEVLPHPAYSPDIAPTDYHFFKHLDNFLTGKIFDNQEALQEGFMDLIASTTPSFYRTGIESLVERWAMIVDANGNYFD